ncbi:hypothetical protein GCM10022393_02290 [Aquimarina addita]|uniref:N-acetyltransferase domain-containing protein n=1 Tax=Aquimarina addita TaxID=870485 RepID=A0ABP7X917_9FLAO
MKFSLRNAKITDADAISKLSGQLGYPSDSNITKNRLLTILNNDGHCVFVSINQKKVIGWIHGFYSLRVESDPFVEIGGLIVERDFRNNGIARKLVESVMNWGQERRCMKIRVRCNALRRESHEFYKKIAFTLDKEQKIFDRQLSAKY